MCGFEMNGGLYSTEKHLNFSNDLSANLLPDVSASTFDDVLVCEA